jgi:ATP-dependent RNA helicase DDX10/DBP4
LRSIHLHKDKAAFNLAELPAERFAESLGLPGAPKIKFLSKEVAKQKKNKSRAVEAAQAEVRKETADAQVDSEEEDSGDEGDVHDSSDEEGGGEPDKEEDEDESAKKVGFLST